MTQHKDWGRSKSLVVVCSREHRLASVASDTVTWWVPELEGPEGRWVGRDEN